MKFQKKYIQNCLQFPNFIIRRLFLTILLVVANSDINSQEAKSQEVKIADVHEIDRSPFPDASIYERINFPEPSIIIKKDGVTIYKKVEGSTVKHSLINMKW